MNEYINPREVELPVIWSSTTIAASTNYWNIILTMGSTLLKPIDCRRSKNFGHHEE